MLGVLPLQKYHSSIALNSYEFMIDILNYSSKIRFLLIDVILREYPVLEYGIKNTSLQKVKFKNIKFSYCN